MPKTPPGRYEILITESLAVDLAAVATDLVDRQRLHEAGAADRLALHVGRALERIIDAIPG